MNLHWEGRLDKLLIAEYIARDATTVQLPLFCPMYSDRILRA